MIRIPKAGARQAIAALFVSGMAGVAAGPLAGQELFPTETAPLIESTGAPTTGRWIIGFNADPHAQRVALDELGALRRAGQFEALRTRVAQLKAAQHEQRRELERFLGERDVPVLGSTWLAQAIAIEDPGRALLEELRTFPGVVCVEADRLHPPMQAQANDAAHHDVDGAHALDLAGVPIKGSGVTVGVIDSGLDLDMNGTGRPHRTFFPNGDPAQTTGGGLSGSRVISAEVFNIATMNPTTEDVLGHGTRVGAMLAGAKFNGLPDVADGVAPETQIRSYKVAEDSLGGAASTWTMSQALGEAVVDGDVAVANLSYGGEPASQSGLSQAIDNAVLADVFVSVSGGNFGASMDDSHGSFNAIAAGGSFEHTIEPANVPGLTISAIGPLPGGRRYPHMLAQGVSLTTALQDAEGSFVVSFGTSGASALIGGAAALVRQVGPQLSALETRALLLNTAREVPAGDQAATGWGYLQVKDAVEAALAGEVQRETIHQGEPRTFTRLLQAGDEVQLTLVWDREQSVLSYIDDLDLRVRDPLGQIVEWSASAIDNTEQLRFTAQHDGLYLVEVLPISFANDTASDFALAGVDAPSLQGQCSGGGLEITGSLPSEIPVLTAGKYDSQHLLGCGFQSVTWLKVAGLNTAVSTQSANVLGFHMPIVPTLGATTFEISTGSQTAQKQIEVVAVEPILRNNTNTIGLGGSLSLDIGGPPGSLYVIYVSPDLIPTSIPGIFELEIGNGFTTMYPLFVGFLDPFNGVNSHIQGVPFGYPATQSFYIHLQGVMVDGISGALPAQATNVISPFVAI